MGLGLGNVDHAGRATPEQLAEGRYRCETRHRESHPAFGILFARGSRKLERTDDLPPRLQLTTASGPIAMKMEEGMRLRLIGANTSYLAQRWLERRMVDNSDDEEAVELHSKPNSDALCDCYLKRLWAQAKDVSVGWMLDDGIPLSYEKRLLEE
jgi:hypothetical protein